MELLRTIFSNHMLNLCFLSWFTAQFCKFLLTLALHHRLAPERFYGSGGMPSAHTATVCSLMMGAVRRCGYSSVEFAICAILAMIVIYDALGVRRAAGRHAGVINRLLQWDEFTDVAFEGDEAVTDEDGDGHKDPKMLNELIGHTPMEVMGGAMVGILVSLIYNHFAYMA